MERSEPTFVPEWYKISNSSAAGSGNSNHQRGFSLQSDEHKTAFSSRSRLAVSICDYDAPQSLSLSERTSSSLRRSSSSNGCIGCEKDFSSRICNSFGRNQRDRDMNRDQDFEIHDRDKPLFPDHRFSDYADVSWSVKSEKDSLRRSQSTLLRRRADSWLKRAGHDSSNGYQSMGGSGRISGVTKYSFERDFPSLGAEEKHVGSDAIRVCSPVQTISYHNLPVTTTINRVDSWTSVLAEVPIVGGNGLIVSSALQKSSVLATSSTSTGLNMTATGLNMAETVAQAPARALTTPQLPNDSQKIEKLHHQQFLKLRPVTPSMPKNLQVVNPADKSKTKGLKIAEYSTVKMGQHMSSQPAHRSVRSNIKPDLPKTSQSAHFHVLNWEKNGASFNVKDSLHPRNGSRSAITYLTGQVHPKHGVNGKASALASSSFGEKKPSSQAQNRNDFFNSLRKKSPSGQENTNQDTRCGASAPSSEKSGVVDAGVSEKEKDASPNCSEENGNSSGSLTAVEEPERLVPDEEEAAFLRSLGWEENAGEEALTPEEIQSFLSEYEKKKPVSKLKVAGCSAKLSSSSETQAEASFC